MRSWILIVFVLAGCAPKKHGNDVKSSNIDWTMTAFFSGGSVFCDATFSLKDDPTKMAIPLENEALVTCNGTIMPLISNFYSIVLPYVPGFYTVSLRRPVDGSVITRSIYVY